MEGINTKLSHAHTLNDISSFNLSNNEKHVLFMGTTAARRMIVSILGVSVCGYVKGGCFGVGQ